MDADRGGSYKYRSNPKSKKGHERPKYFTNFARAINKKTLRTGHKLKIRVETFTTFLFKYFQNACL
jgi:hypothetical protein